MAVRKGVTPTPDNRIASKVSRGGADRNSLIKLGAPAFLVPLNTFDRHLLREWLSIFCLMLALMCGLLLVHVMLDDFRDLHESGARAADLLRYIVVTIPGFLTVTLPIVLLTSTLYVLGKLHKANELSAMRAAGVGFGRLMAPIWLVGVLFCALSWWLNASVVPWSVERARSMKEEFQFRKQAKVASADQIGLVFSVGYDNSVDRRMWFFNRYSKFTGKAYGVFVTEMDVRRRETSRVAASEGWYDEKLHGWVFVDGRVMTFDPDKDAEKGENMSSVPFERRFYPRYQEDPKLMMLIDRRPIDLSFNELGQLMDYFSSDNNSKGVPYAVRYYELVADVLSPLILIAIAIPFAVTGVRVNPVVGVSKSIVLFFVYFLLKSLAEALATKQLVDPGVAAWLPDIGMAALAAVLFSRLR
jgi:lipopolysaccharide export system permease protein